ncbi:MAG: ATP-binding protein [Pseudomonadota bacterium]
MDKWFAEKVAPYAIPTWLKQTIGGLASLIILLIGLSLFLKKRIKEQTSDLLSLTEKLRASEEQYRELFDNAPAAYFTIDAKNERVKRYNLGAQKMLGYAPEVLAEMKVLDLYSESPSGKGKAKEIFERFKHGESINDEELQMVNSDGKPLWVSLSVEPVKDIDGNVIESRSMAVNISNRKQLEEHLRQAQKMEAIGTLAGGIAHDFNNILAAILGFSEFVKRDLPEYSKAREDIEQVIQSGKRATELVKQILTFSRQTEQQRQPLQIHLVIKEALKFLRSSIPTTIAIQQNVVDCGLVMADPTQVHQIIMNLCTNAYHAMQETGGELDVSMEVVELTTEDYIDSLVMQPGPHVKLSVRDTGCGMSKELVERIFDPYFTTKKQGEGTGLGLSMVHGIVESHHGHITVYSEPGKGTEFHVYLPQVQRHDQILTEETGEKIPKGSGTVLVVDDEPIIGEMLRRMLGDLGYEVLLCASSTEALELFTQQRARIALVLTDMNMPVMNGAELVRRIKQLSPAMPVVLCTGFSEIMDEKKARRMGIDGFLMKPVILHKLAQTLHDILEKKGGSGPAV